MYHYDIFRTNYNVNLFVFVKLVNTIEYFIDKSNLFIANHCSTKYITITNIVGSTNESLLKAIEHEIKMYEIEQQADFELDMFLMDDGLPISMAERI